MLPTTTRLTMHAIAKRFGATIALDRVDLSIAPGEVHALIGENGAGKSTLMKVISGAIRPDAGAMSLDALPFAPSGPQAARQAGVAIVYQELNLAPHLTVEQNMTLGIERHACGMIRRSGLRDRVIEALARLNRPEIRPSREVAALSPAERQLVEIARALMTDARVLILDEPTSSLGMSDIEHLFRVIDGLRSEGVSVIYISHFLEEVQRIADRYTVLRDGRTVGAGRMADATMKQLIELMIGRKLDEMFPRVPHEIGEPILRVESLCGCPLPIRADLTLHRGEILGLAGLVGAGRTELVRTIFGLDRCAAGTVEVCRSELHSRRTTEGPLHRRSLRRRGSLTPAAQLACGVGLLSEDRQREGLAVGQSIMDNCLLSHTAPFSWLGWLNVRAMRRTTRDLIHRLGIRSRGPDQCVRDLSGGNQQKVALARLLHHDCDVLLLDEPTRGIDVASKAQIYQLIGQLAARGKAVLLISSYTPELLGVCDRIAVMHRGRLGPARPVSEWTQRSIMEAALGAA